jgi:FkbM family methyltransferase
MIRSLLEAYSRNKIIKRYMPKRFGGEPIFVSPDSALRYWNPTLDSAFQPLFRWAESYVTPGDVVWDVGANVGLFAFAAAGLAGNAGAVVAIEPDTFLVELLRRSAEARGKDGAPVTIVPAAVSDEVRLASFSVAARGRSANHLSEVTGSTMHGGARRMDHVITVTLDWMCVTCPPPDVVKIDVEGAEMLTLRGGQKTLTAHRPLLICEVRPKTCKEVTSFLRERDYAMFDADAPRHGELAEACYNTLAVPRERAGGFGPAATLGSINAPSHSEHPQRQALHP